MDKEIYERWWKLHLRVAKGEELAPQELAEYQNGLAVLDDEEAGQLRPGKLSGDLIAAKTRIIELQIIHNQLLLKSTRLDAQIVQLEQAYQLSIG